MSVRPRRRASDRKKRDDRTGLLLIAACMAVLVLGGLLFWYSQQPKRSLANGCPIGVQHSDPAHTIILVDQTDALPKAELTFARDLIYNEYMWLPENGRLTIRSITASVATNKDDIEVCRVKVGAEGNGVTNNSNALDRSYRQMVGDKLNKFLGAMASVPPQADSPIAESIDELYQRPDFDKDIKARRLVLLSDMAQHSAAYSHYGKAWKTKFKPPRDFAASYDADMTGTSVRVQYIRRPGIKFQGAAHKDFWRRYFMAKHADDVAIGHSLELGEKADRPVWHVTPE